MDGGQCPPYIRISRLRRFSITQSRVGRVEERKVGRLPFRHRNYGMFQVECRGKMPLLHNANCYLITEKPSFWFTFAKL